MQPSGQVFLEARPRLLQARSAQWLEVPRNQSPAAVFVAGCSLPLPWGRTLVDFWALSQAGGRPRRGPLPAASLSRWPGNKCERGERGVSG